MELSSKRILIVDDEDTLRETLMDYLELQGASVLEARNGNEAFDIIQNGGIDLVLSDIKMPECSGIELLKKVQTYERKTPPIIMMSGFTDFSESQIKDLGAKAMFMKPGTLSQLKELILETIT